jgi:hypothetical protein
MAKSKNHTSHNQSNKAHKNGASRAGSAPRRQGLPDAAARRSAACRARWQRSALTPPLLSAGIKKPKTYKYSSTKGVRSHALLRPGKPPCRRRRDAGRGCGTAQRPASLRRLAP